MCYHRIKIYNPSLSYTKYKSREMYVPCGQCADCRRKQHNDWFIRAWYEWKRYHKHGMVLLVSLTYNPRNTPHYEDVRDYQYITLPDGKIGTIKKPVNFRCECFDMKDLSNFRKEFRTNIERRLKMKSDGIKFLICSEYGKLHGHSHYHAMIYLPFKIKISQFEDVLKHSWNKGFFGRSKKFGYIVNGVKGIRYSTKYVCKDLNFFSEDIQTYLDRESLDPAEYEFRLSEFRNYMPSHRQSIGFGENLVNEIKNMDDPASFLCSEKPIKVPQSKGEVAYDVPKYVMDKCCRTMSQSFSHLLGRPYFITSPLGHQVKLLRSLEGVKRDAVELYRLQDPLYINTCLHDKMFYPKRVSYLADNLSQLLLTLDLPKLAFYRRFLRFLPAETYPFKTAEGYFENCDEIVDNYFSDLALPPELLDSVSDLHPDSLSDFGIVKTDKYGRSFISSSPINMDYRSIPIDENKWLKKCDTVSDLRIFEEYENASRYLDDFDMLFSIVKEKNYLDRLDRTLNVRECLREYILTPSN